MTLSSLMNWGGFGKTPATPLVERYHSGGHWDHKSHGHGGWKSGGGGGKGGGGGSGAALSALALLAFLFLINVMQQSLQDNNSTATTTVATAVLLREGQTSFDGRATNIHQDKYEKTGSSNAEKKSDTSRNPV